MVHLYISDSASRVSLSRGRIIVCSDETGETSHPVDTVDSVVIFGRPSMTTPFIIEMIGRQVDIQLFTTDGHYQGRISGPGTTYAPRLRAQVQRSDDPVFALTIAKRLVSAKIRNQIALVEAHVADRDRVDKPLQAMRHSLTWIEQAVSISEANGFEGNAAKAYFTALATLVPSDFTFKGRSTRPPKDAFNSMISLGYSLLYKNMIGAVERHGLNAYIGFLHQDSRNHATLASDVMETWRAPIIDDTVLRLLSEGEVSRDDFTRRDDTGAVYGNRDNIRSITRAFGNRIARPAAYLADDPRRYTFQYALDLQLQSLVRAIEESDPSRLADVVEVLLARCGHPSGSR